MASVREFTGMPSASASHGCPLSDYNPSSRHGLHERRRGALHRSSILDWEVNATCPSIPGRLTRPSFAASLPHADSVLLQLRSSTF